MIDEDKISENYNNTKFNQNFYFIFKPYVFLDNKEKPLPDEFVKLVNSSNNQTIKTFTTLDKRVSDIDGIIILMNETIYNKLLKNISFSLKVFHHGYILDHQNESSPLHKVPEDHITYGE